MTTNAYIFSWDYTGIDSIIPITHFENHDKNNLILLLKGECAVKNPLDGIVNRLILRAKFNTQRRYEIYAIDCSKELDINFWKQQWNDFPQQTAELIRERGYKLYSDRESYAKAKIVIE